MRLNKQTIISYLIIGGFVFYLLRATLSAIFLASIPMDSDWCKNGREIQVSDFRTEYICFEFKDDWQETIYYYNLKIIDRNKTLIWSVFILASLVTLFTFLLIPYWRGTIDQDIIKIIGYSIMISLGITFIVPLIYSWIFPPPVDWLPEIFERINDAQINEAVKELKKNYH